MNDFFKLISTFVDAIALILALVLLVSLLQRTDRKRFSNSFVMGGLFSLVLLLSMSDPIDLGAAGIFDMRGLMIGAAAALFGPVAGLITLTVGFAMRIWIGNPGVIPGLVGMLCAYGAGVLWLYMIRGTALHTWQKSILLGVLITFQMMAIFAAPSAIWGDLAVKLIPYTLVTNVLGALLINYLISGELSFLSAADSARRHATTDHLTGLLNRRGLSLAYPVIEQSQRSSRGHAIITFDVDRFKTINDAYGHGVGDAVLKYITKEVASNLRPNDVFARLGGDEFAIVLGQIEKSEAEHIAERCRHVVAQGEFMHKDKVLPISISVGAMWMLGQSEFEDVFEEADRALYAAKTGGRNKVVFKSGIGQWTNTDLAIPA